MIKKSTLVLWALIVFVSAYGQNNIGIGISNPDPSAVLHLDATNKGFLTTRLSAQQRLLIAAPADGLLVYDTDSACFFYWKAVTSSWNNLCSSPGNQGPTGAQGAQGIQGPMGAVGPAGPAGAVGPAGAIGPAGPAGPAGAIGPAGAAGAVGPAGPAGAAGAVGAIGPAGPAGAAGAVGPAGAAGAIGPTGPDWTITSTSFNNTGTFTINTSIPSVITSTNSAWLTTGNMGTTPATNFIGTLDANDFVTKTGGAAAINERMRVASTGKVVVNNTVPSTTSVFSVYGTGTAGAINALDDTAIAGYSTGATGIGVYGQNTAGAGIGVEGYTNTMNAMSVYGLNPVNVTGVGNIAIGVEGNVTGTVSANSFSIGVIGFAPAGNATVAVAGGQAGAAIYIPPGGAGGAFGGTAYGEEGYASTAASGIGVYGSGNGLITVLSPTSGAGVLGNGTRFGVAGYATTEKATNGGNAQSTNLNNASSGGYFEVDGGGFIQTWAYVGVEDNGFVLRKIIGPGTVNTIVKDTKDNLVALSCPETPEDLFQDYGSGSLVNGQTHITIDPILSKNITVDEKHPLRVFVQLEGDCNGVYIANKTQYGFDVIELGGGKSNIPFSWSLSANRADEVLADGHVSRYSAERFASAPGPAERNVKKLEKVPSLTLKHISGK